jgi:type I restriction enzyme, S subunit
MRLGWRNEPFDAVIADESGGNVKTPQSEFLPAGRYAVVDQGKELIAGYVNDEARLCRAKLPAIVFGDHTRCFKYVDFPFCMGADGVKVLRPRIDADVKYLYHYLRQLRLTEGGYDRHFKYLKRSSVVLPPLPEQRRISEILDKADALRAKRRAALAQLDTLTQSIFLNVFGDPATNPKGWPWFSLGALLRGVTNGMTRRRAEADRGQSIVLRLRDIREGWIDFSEVNRITLTADERSKYEVLAGDLLFIRVNGNPDYVGRCALFEGHSESVYFNDHVMRVRVDRSSVNGVFLTFLLNGAHGKNEIAKHRKTSAGQHTINQDGLGSIRLPLPPLPVQVEFARCIAAVEKAKTGHTASLADLDGFFASLQHRAFRGEL